VQAVAHVKRICEPFKICGIKAGWENKCTTRKELRGDSHLILRISLREERRPHAGGEKMQCTSLSLHHAAEVSLEITSGLGFLWLRSLKSIMVLSIAHQFGRRFKNPLQFLHSLQLLEFTIYARASHFTDFELTASLNTLPMVLCQ
jgi:hypothetical protein